MADDPVKTDIFAGRAITVPGAHGGALVLRSGLGVKRKFAHKTKQEYPGKHPGIRAGIKNEFNHSRTNNLWISNESSDPW
jgi:hypothetical protein